MTSDNRKEPKSMVCSLRISVLNKLSLINNEFKDSSFFKSLPLIKVIEMFGFELNVKNNSSSKFIG